MTAGASLGHIYIRRGIVNSVETLENEEVELGIEIYNQPDVVLWPRSLVSHRCLNLC